MKRVAGEREPVVVIPVVVEPIEVGLTIGLVPPDIRNVALALEGMYEMPSVPPPIEYSPGCI